MCKVICVTERRLCRESFLHRIGMICQSAPDSIILREKDLPEKEYITLAAEVMELCERYGTDCTLHTYADAAAELGARRIHLPLPILRELTAPERFDVIGVSVHSPAEAQEAQRLGAAYVTSGHVFATDCKAGLPGRGLDFIRETVSAVSIPVYAIGGISPSNAGAVIAAGAAGICIRSGFMVCEDTSAYMNGLRSGINERKA